MSNSITARFFLVSLIIVVFSFSTLAGIMFFLTERYSFEEKVSMMSSNAGKISELTVTLSENNTYAMQITYRSTLNLLADISDTSILVALPDGQLFFASENQAVNTETTVPEAAIARILSTGEFSSVSNLGGLYPNNRFVVGEPVLDREGYLIASVFVSSSASGYSEMLSNMVRIFILSSLSVLFLTFIVIYFSTRQMVKPLKEMSRAAKSFAKGNFNTRVAVRGSDEIAELAVAFNNMATSLASLEELRTGFIANVSHDLRTPMTTISGFIDGILDGTIPREDESHYLTVVSNEIKRLSKLVHTLLELSKIESGQIEYHPVRFDICESMRKLLLSFEQSINNKRLQVELSLCEERFEVVADEDAIARVMYNLIDNAIKFSYPDGVLTLSITRGDKNDRNVYVSVKNTGVGIPESDLPYVFERFYKSDKSRGLDKTGSGLGLYIVKSIIDRHGGRITVKSVQNEFCEFVFSLPLETEEK